MSNNLLLSDHSITSIHTVAAVQQFKIVESDLEMRLVSPRIQLRVFQPDIFPAYLCCHFIVQDCPLCIEDVWFAINGREMPNPYTSNGQGEIHKQIVRKKNDIYVKQLVDFLAANEANLAQWPPPWFPAASLHAAQETAKNFPDVASQEFAAREKLWVSMCHQERST